MEKDLSVSYLSKTTVDWSQLYLGNLTWLTTHTIFLTRAGSHAYGRACNPGE